MFNEKLLKRKKNPADRSSHFQLEFGNIVLDYVLPIIIPNEIAVVL